MNECNGDSCIQRLSFNFVQVLILATGYRVQDFWSPLIVIGRNSKDLFETMKAKKYAHYLGIVVSEAPNAFMVLGPNTVDLNYNANEFRFKIVLNSKIFLI
jgi:cation diffusion facilitator CzcD-associated flavoprotein CzcO